MSAWSMNDGSALTGTITTNTSSGTEMNVAGSSTAFTTEVAVGDVLQAAPLHSTQLNSAQRSPRSPIKTVNELKKGGFRRRGERDRERERDRKRERNQSINFALKLN